MSWGGSEFSGGDRLRLDLRRIERRVRRLLGRQRRGHPDAVGRATGGGVAGGLAQRHLRRRHEPERDSTTNTDGSYFTYGSETAWSGSGGGVSRYEPAPSSQYNAFYATNRMVPDVAYDAEPVHRGRRLRFDAETATVGWLQFGGTSIGAPQWAGLFALTDQALAAHLGPGRAEPRRPPGNLEVPLLQRVYRELRVHRVARLSRHHERREQRLLRDEGLRPGDGPGQPGREQPFLLFRPRPFPDRHQAFPAATTTGPPAGGTATQQPVVASPQALFSAVTVIVPVTTGNRPTRPCVFFVPNLNPVATTQSFQPGHTPPRELPTPGPRLLSSPRVSRPHPRGRTSPWTRGKPRRVRPPVVPDDGDRFHADGPDFIHTPEHPGANGPADPSQLVPPLGRWDQVISAFIADQSGPGLPFRLPSRARLCRGTGRSAPPTAPSWRVRRSPSGAPGKSAHGVATGARNGRSCISGPSVGINRWMRPTPLEWSASPTLYPTGTDHCQRGSSTSRASGTSEKTSPSRRARRSSSEVASTTWSVRRFRQRDGAESGRTSSVSPQTSGPTGGAGGVVAHQGGDQAGGDGQDVLALVATARRRRRGPSGRPTPRRAGTRRGGKGRGSPGGGSAGSRRRRA